MTDTYDLIVLGGGTGGYSAALRATQLGKRVALVERDARLGGTCLLRGCIPTKALLRSAEVMDTVARSSQWGVTAGGTSDREGILSFQRTVVDRLVTGLTQRIKECKIEVIRGLGHLVPGPGLEVDGRELTAADVVLASGSRPRLLPDVSIGARVVTSDEALELPSIPESAVVIGAGAIGLEFASFYRSMGAEVTLLEALPRIAPLEDEDISKTLARSFKKRGIETRAGVRVVSVDEVDERVDISYETPKGGAELVSADLCLVAVGRAPVSDGMGYEEAGVELERGFVKVDDSLRTSLQHVWAVGDVASTPLQFAHVAFAEGIAVAERIAGMDVPAVDYTGVAKVTFCSPEIASVGYTEDQARAAGHEVVVERFQFQGLGKAQMLGEGGLAKFIADASGRILGIHMVGPHVTDLVSEAMLITNWQALAGDVAKLIHPHPTLSEALGEAALALAGKPLHG